MLLPCRKVLQSSGSVVNSMQAFGSSKLAVLAWDCLLIDPKLRESVLRSVLYHTKDEPASCRGFGKL